MSGTDRRTDAELLERTRQETKKPELYKVFLLNDDYTTMDFVVEVLETVFHKQPSEAYRIMVGASAGRSESAPQMGGCGAGTCGCRMNVN